MGWGLFWALTAAAAAVTAFLYPCFVLAGRCSRGEDDPAGMDSPPDP